MNDLSPIQNFLSDIFRPIITEAIQTSLTEVKQAEPVSEEEGFLTVDEAANYLHISVHTLYGMTSKNKIPYHKPGKKLYFLRSELEDWVASGRRSTNEELKQKGVSKMKAKRNTPWL